jgi:hypothetical protein
MVWLRRVRRAIILLALVEVGLWLFAGWFGWELRYLMVGPGSPEAINRERLAVAIWAGAAVDLLALIPFWSGARWGWSILFLVQIAGIAASLVLLLTVSTDWWLFALLAAIIATLLVAWRRTELAAR